jgi:hypothetical protein
MASFLQLLQTMSRSTALPGLLALLLAACGAEGPPRLSDAGPRPAEIPRRDKQAGKAGAMLAATGRQSFQGPTSSRCVVHDREGLQINFRTGDPEIPAVAVRIEEYRGSGRYPARLFVTGRSRTGALVTSTGEGDLELTQRTLANAGAVLVLNGSFTGAYGGQAGKGSIEGRLGACRYSARRDGPPPAGLAAAP